MCIRASRRSLAICAATPGVGISYVAVNLAMSFAMAGLNTCLLYTSDAADERSSVDLGGRRILQKKKKKKIHADVLVHIYTTITDLSYTAAMNSRLTKTYIT